MSWYIEVERMREKGKLSKKLSVSVTELLNLKDRLENAEKELNNLRRQPQQDTVPPVPAPEQSASIPDMDKVLENLQGALEEKEQIIAKLKEELVVNQDRLLAFSAQLENLSSEKSLPSPSTSLEEESSQLSQFQDENYRLETHVTQLELLMTERAESLNRANDKLQELQRNKVSMEEYISKLKQEMVPMNTHNTALQKIQEQIQHIQALTGDCQRVSSQNSDLQNQLAAKERELKNIAPTMVMTPSLVSKPASATSSSQSSSPQSMTPTVPSSSSYDSYYSQEAINQDTTRLVCPQCGASGSKISVVDDKTRIISYSPRPIYRKKNVCNQCGFEF
ncbi:MAG: hypothetical protein ACTSWW_06250 [Promethearchaeota archaeon]